MKNILSISAFLFAILLISSCKKEEDEGKLPNIAFKTGATYVSSDITLSKDTTITVGITASKSEPNDLLISFDASKSYDNAVSFSSVFSETLTGSNGDAYSKDLTIQTRSVAGSEKYTFTVINKDGLKNSVSLTITVN
jgi:hypothetical protein